MVTDKILLIQTKSLVNTNAMHLGSFLKFLGMVFHVFSLTFALLCSVRGQAS